MLWLTLFLLNPVDTILAQPTNDNFADRSSILGSFVNVTGNNASATHEPRDPTEGYKSVWWQWTAPTSGTYTVTADALAGSFYPFLGVYTGSSLFDLGLVASDTFNGMNSTFEAQVVINAAGGTTYDIAVAAVGGTGGDLSLRIVPTVPPQISITNPTNTATFYLGEAVDLKADASDSDGTITNVVFYLDFVPIASFTNEPYHLTVTLTNGPENYRFQVRATDNWGITSISSEVLFLVTYPPPSNDDYVNRVLVTGVPVLVTGNNEYATREAGEPIQGDKSVWWEWTAPTSGVYTMTVDSASGGFSPFLGVYTGSALSELSLLEGNEYYDAYIARVVIDATESTAYAIGVTTVGGMGGDFRLSIVPTAPPTVIITSPTNNPIFYVGEAIDLRVDASDSDGILTNVVFYLDSVPIASFTKEPYHLSVTLTNGPENYRFQVRATDNWGVTSVANEVQFLVTHRPPDNDDFASRIPITGVPVQVSGDNRYATRELGEPTLGEKSVWWDWTAPTSGVYTVTVTGLESFYPFLGVCSGPALSNIVLVASNQFNGLDHTYAARVAFDATEGTHYALVVTTVAGDGGELTLCVMPPTQPDAPSRFDSILPIPGDSFRLQFSTGASSTWELQTSTNFLHWEARYIQFLPNGVYSIRDFTDLTSSHRFYRLKAEP